MKTVLILAPRLDVPFKNFGPVSSMRGPIEPIRKHWETFIGQIKQLHDEADHKVLVIERPMWQFSPEETNAMISTFNVDIVYIPHREAESFPIVGATPKYYMQTVFPWRFYVDHKGYAGGSSLYGNLDLSMANDNDDWFRTLRAYALQGRTKFDQPTMGKWASPGEFVAFTCQLPHDHTIKYHSDVSVEDALRETCEVTKKLHQTLVVKGHVISRDSMAPLRAITEEYTHTIWNETANIHDVLSQAKAVVTVNSGTGMEALLHKKPVATFGRAEYDVVTYKLCAGKLEEFLIAPTFDQEAVNKFFDIWCRSTIDTRNEQPYL